MEATQAAQAPAVDEATLYPEKDGFFGRKAKKRRAALLAGIADVLGKALAQGEPVRYATQGIRYSFGEFYFAGWAAYHHNRVALVVTDRRLILVQLHGKKAGDIKLQVPFAKVRGARVRFLGGWLVKLADGSKLAFTSVKRADQKRLAALLPATEGPKEVAASLEHLCPACLRVVPGPVGSTLTCPEPTCRIPFRDPRRAARLSALVPGLGDLYLRHHLFGSLEFLGSMLALGVGLGLAIGFGTGGGAGAAIAALILALVLGIPRLIDWRLTLYMGRKGIVPLALAPAPGAQARNLPSYPRWSPLLFGGGVVLAGVLGLLFAAVGGSVQKVDRAVDLAREGKLDEAVAAAQALQAGGDLDDADRVKIATILAEAGDLHGAGQVFEWYGGGQVEQELVDRWQRTQTAQEAAFEAMKKASRALAEGDAAAARPHLDAALRWHATIKRPHSPATRDELVAHLAAFHLAPPVDEPTAEAVERLLAAAPAAPAAERAALDAVLASARGDAATAAARLAAVKDAPLAPEFQLLLLELRREQAGEDEAAAAAVRSAAQALRPQLTWPGDLERVASLAGQ